MENLVRGCHNHLLSDSGESRNRGECDINRWKVNVTTLNKQNSVRMLSPIRVGIWHSLLSHGRDGERYKNPMQIRIDKMRDKCYVSIYMLCCLGILKQTCFKLLQLFYWFDACHYSFTENDSEANLSSEKLQKLGWKYRPLEEILRDAVLNYEEKGILCKA